MLLSFIIIFLAVAADFATKQFAVLKLANEASYPVIEGVLHFTYVENTGAAFGILQNHRWVFMVLSSVAIIALVTYLVAVKPKETVVRVSLALIIAGGVGNMIDRIAYGYVVDFIDVRLIDFYVFNVADSCVCVGCGLLILWLIISEIREVKKSRANAAALDKNTAADGKIAETVDSGKTEEAGTEQTLGEASSNISKGKDKGNDSTDSDGR